MELSNWVFGDADRRLAEGLRDRVPVRVLDAHAHIYRRCDIGRQGAAYGDGPDVVGAAVWERWARLFLGEACRIDAVHVAPPAETKEQIDGANRFVLSELKTRPRSFGLLLISPDMDRDYVEERLGDGPVRGIKPFCTYCGHLPDYEAPLAAFLPEWAWQTAHDHGLTILAHLMTRDALNNGANYRYIHAMCRRYPNARLMLDHGARGFCAYNTVKGIRRLSGLRNVYVDTSSLCEPLALLAAIRTLGADRVVFGTDFPLTQLRGRAVTAGDGFVWVTNENFNWESYRHVCNPVLLGLESLRNVFDVCDIEGLSPSQIEDIFLYNAMEMLKR